MIINIQDINIYDNIHQTQLMSNGFAFFNVNLKLSKYNLVKKIILLLWV